MAELSNQNLTPAPSDGQDFSLLRRRDIRYHGKHHHRACPSLLLPAREDAGLAHFQFGVI